HFAVLRDHHVACAVEAALLTERQVRVERERIVGLGVGRAQALAVVGLAEALGELDRGGIRGVARPGAVVALEQLRRGGRSHWALGCGGFAGAFGHARLGGARCGRARRGRGAHTSLLSRDWTASTRASTDAIGVSGRLPW